LPCTSHYRCSDRAAGSTPNGRQGWTVERKIFLAGQRTATFLANLLAEMAVFLVRK